MENSERPTRQRKYFDNVRRPNGSVIWWLKRRGKRIPVTCGSCGTTRDVFDGKVGSPDFSGLCHACGVKKRTGDETHRSGATIHWGERQGSNAEGTLKVAFTCRGCGSKSSTPPLVFKYPNWRGLCPSCRPPARERKFTGDETLPSGAVIRFGTPGRKVEIVCICGDVRLISRARALLLMRDGRRTGYCEEHTRNAGAVYDLLKHRELQHVTEDGSQPTLGEPEKRGRGRRLGDKLLDDRQVVADIKGFMVEIWRETGLLDSVSQKAVATKFHLRGERIGEKAVKRRLERAGIKTPWSEFRQAVLREAGEL